VTWTDRGSDTLEDAFTELGFGNIYVATPSTVDGPGVCVINMSTLGQSEFDIICQGPRGKACFWAGYPWGSTQTPAPPMTSVQLLDNNWNGTGMLITHSSTAGDVTTGCTNCHLGENAFITHMEPPTHPLSLNVSFNPDGTQAHGALPNWMPSSWFDPIMSSNAPVHNPGPNPYVGYYPTSTSGCLGCHIQSYAGRFPSVANHPSGGNSSFCDILDEVTNRPAFSPPSGAAGGGMPPYASNTCVAGSCAHDTDPFVQAMHATCNGLAVSFANSPVAIDANVPANPGSFDYLLTDTETPSVGSPTFELMENLYTGGAFRGWEVSSIGYFGFYSRFRGTIWVKNLATSTDLAYATNDATDSSSGNIWERTGGGDIRNVTQFPSNSTVFAAGSPSAYLRHDGYNAIVFRGTDKVIYESYWDFSTAQWYTSSLFAAVDPTNPPLPANGDPIGYNRGSSSSVVYKCGETTMCELRLVDRWYYRPIPTIATIQPYVAMPIRGSYNGQHTIFYTGVDGVHALEDMCEPWFSCGSPNDSLLFADPAVASAPVPYNDQNGGTSVVYIADGGGGSPSFVVQLANDGAGWKASTLANADKAVETFVGDPAAYLAVAPRLNTILFRNSAGLLYELQWDPSSSTYVKSRILF
jgi:hypothetical protein